MPPPEATDQPLCWAITTGPPPTILTHRSPPTCAPPLCRPSPPHVQARALIVPLLYCHCASASHRSSHRSCRRPPLSKQCPYSSHRRHAKASPDTTSCHLPLLPRLPHHFPVAPATKLARYLLRKLCHDSRVLYDPRDSLLDPVSILPLPLWDPFPVSPLTPPPQNWLLPPMCCSLIDSHTGCCLLLTGFAGRHRPTPPWAFPCSTGRWAVSPWPGHPGCARLE
jgi:hypothetical protein